MKNRKPEVDAIVFDNWPTDYSWLTFYKLKKGIVDYNKFMEFEKYFGHLSVKDRARRMGVSRGHYDQLIRKYLTSI